MKHKTFSQTNRRFFILYLLFAASVSLLFLPLYGLSYRMSRENVLEQTQHVLASGIATLDSAGTAILNTYLMSSSDANFRLLCNTNNVSGIGALELLQMSKSLQNPFLFFTIIRDVGIVCSDISAITRQRIFYSSTLLLYPDFLSCEELDFGEWRSFLSNSDKNGSWFAAREYHSPDFGYYTALTYAHKWQRAKTSGDTPVVFYTTLDCDLLTDLLVDAEILEDGYLRIFDSQGNQLYTCGAPVGNENAYAKLTGNSAATLFNIEVGVSSRYILKQTRSLLNLFLCQFSLMTIAILILVGYFSRRSSQPMHLLLRSISDLGLPTAQTGDSVSRGKASELKSDYSIVSSSIISLNNQLKISAGIINEQETQLQTHLFSKALTGGLYSSEDKKYFERLFPAFPATYRLIRIHADRKNLAKDINPFSHIIQAAEAENAMPYFHHYFGYSTMIWLSADDAVKAATLARICERAQVICGISFECLVTQRYYSADALPIAYQQLQFYTSTFAAHPGVKVISDDDFSATPRFLPVNYPVLHEIYKALSAGKDAHACMILSGITDHIFTSLNNPSIISHVYTMLYDMMVQLKMEYTEKLGRIHLPLFDEARCEWLFREKLPECFQSIGTLMRESIEQDNDASRIMQFINNNICSSDLCLTYVSEQLGVTKATVQSVVKSLVGVTFFVYVERKRLEYACVLLKDNMPVQEVSTACGFSSPNTFYKAFKRKYDVSPTGYAEGKSSDADQ